MNFIKFKSDIKFEYISCSVNHAVAVGKGELYSWGIDRFTGRLGVGYNFFDPEKDED